MAMQYSDPSQWKKLAPICCMDTLGLRLPAVAVMAPVGNDIGIQDMFQLCL